MPDEQGNLTPEEQEVNNENALKEQEAKQQTQDEKDLTELHEKLCSMDAKESVDAIKGIIDKQVSQRMGMERIMEARDEFFSGTSPEVQQRFESDPNLVGKVAEYIKAMPPQERQAKGKKAIKEAFQHVVGEMDTETLQRLTRKDDGGKTW